MKGRISKKAGRFTQQQREIPLVVVVVCPQLLTAFLRGHLYLILFNLRCKSTFNLLMELFSLSGSSAQLANLLAEVAAGAYSSQKV